MKAAITSALALGLSLTAAAALAQPPASAPTAPPPPTPATGMVTAIPANLKPSRLAATAIAVVDLPAQEKWYETVFGFIKVRDVGANEILLSLDPKDPNSVVLALQRSKTRQPGATTYGRMIINVDNAKDVAAFLQSHGVTTRQVIPNQAYFLNDPEGNLVEIYQPTPPVK